MKNFKSFSELQRWCLKIQYGKVTYKNVILQKSVSLICPKDENKVLRKYTIFVLNLFILSRKNFGNFFDFSSANWAASFLFKNGLGTRIAANLGPKL